MIFKVKSSQSEVKVKVKWFSRVGRRSKKVPEGLGRSKKVQEGPRGSKKVQEGPRRSKKVQEGSRRF